MRSNRLWIAAVVAMLVAVGVLGRGKAQDVAAPSPARMAVCDVFHVIDNCEQSERLRGQMTEKMEQLKKAAAERQEGIKALKADLPALAEGSKAYEEKVEQIDIQLAEFKVWEEMQNMRHRRRYQQMTEQMYNALLDSTKAIAGERGYQLVLFRDAVDLRSRTPQEMQARMMQRKVLYNDPAIDITDDVTRHMNERFRQQNQ